MKVQYGGAICFQSGLGGGLLAQSFCVKNNVLTIR